MAKEFLHKHFINEAKAAINRWSNIGGSGGTTPAPGGLVEIDVFPERELIFWGGGDEIWTNTMEVMFEIEEGQTYHVSIDGVVHSCVAKKNVYEYDDGSGYYSDTWLGWSYDYDTGNTIYSHPFSILIHTSVVYEGTTYTDWSVGLQGSDDSGEPLPHTIRIYKECKADDMASISTEFSIPTKNHNNGMILYEEPLRLDIGWTYTVRIMGQTYECRCGIEPDWGMLYLGNPLLAGATPNEDDSQYPFFMANIEQDGTRAIGVMIDPNTFPIGEDIHVTCHFKDIGEVKLERATIMESGMHYPSEGYDGFASVDVASTKGGATPGLYLGGSRYNILVKPWDELITEGYIRVDSGTVYKGNNSLSDLINGILIPDMSELPYDTLGGGEILIPNDGSVHTIDTAFQYITNIIGIDFGRSSQVRSIGWRAFEGCTGLMFIDIPSSVETIGNYAFDGCTNMSAVNFDKDSHLTHIGEYAFNNCKGLYYIELPSSLISLNYDVFEGCDNLTIVDFADHSVFANIEKYRPFRRTNITHVDFGKSNQMTATTEDLFYMCYNLIDVDFGDNSQLTAIGEKTFYELTNLESVCFGRNSKLETIGKSAFYGCSALKTIDIPPSVTSIGNTAFRRCVGLKSVNFGTGGALTTIEGYAFNECTGLQNIDLTKCKQLDSIGNGAFGDNPAITSIGPAGSGASVELPACLKHLSGFRNCANLTSVKFGEDSQLESIENGAFANCTLLTSIGPIGSGADVEIPDCVTRIVSNAFQNCTGLTRVKLLNETPPITYTTVYSPFNGCTNLATIEVPASAVDAYKSAPGWSMHADIIVPIT